jgi:hypothetical protein
MPPGAAVHQAGEQAGEIWAALRQSPPEPAARHPAPARPPSIAQRP